MLSSVGMFLHPYLMPHDTPNLQWAIGNKETCLAMGFCLVVFQMMVSCYSCFLSMSFLFTIRYDWSEDKVSRLLERPAHVFAVVFSLFIGISGILTETFLPTVFINTCWIGGCSLYHLYEDGACPEEEINYGWVLGWVFVGVLTINTIVASVSVNLVRRTVRAQTSSNRANSFRGNISQQSEIRQKEVVWQAVSYTCIYVNTFLWYFVNGILLGFDTWIRDREGEWPLYMIQILSWTFIPSQGLLNFIVYTRPVYQQWRRAMPDQSRLFALWKASKLEPPTRESVRSERQRMRNASKHTLSSPSRFLSDSQVTNDEANQEPPRAEQSQGFESNEVDL